MWWIAASKFLFVKASLWLAVHWSGVVWWSFSFFVALAAAVLYVWAVYTYYVHDVAAPELVYVTTEENERVVATCPTLRSTYHPPSLFSSSHLQTIIGSKLRSTPLPDLGFEREWVFLPDGGLLGLDWSGDALSGERTPVVVVLHGLTGGSNEAYVRHMVQACLDQGWRTVVFNFRGAHDIPLTTPRGYSAANTEDLQHVVAHVRRKYVQAPLIAMGFSLGANILTNFLAQLGAQGVPSPFVCAVSMANPFSLTRRAGSEEEMHALYTTTLAKNLVKFAGKHAEMLALHPEISWDDVTRCRTVADFDREVTVRVFGYPSVHAYHLEAGSANRLHAITTPCLFINAADDPIVPEPVIPKAQFEANPALILAVTARGGHCAWLEEGSVLGRSWVDRAAVEYVAAMLLNFSHPSSPK